MSSLYARWASQGVSFSYITASPWQLFVPVEDFLRKTGFPEGTLSMKSFRWKDSSFFDLFVNNGKYKRPLAEEILSRLPHRSFYLVGDSGENDIELYCSLAEVYPNQIKGIFIRRTTEATVESTKKDGVCRTVLDKLQFFDSPTQLPSVLLP
jgi:phosphatidate phosphatase APP1